MPQIEKWYGDWCDGDGLARIVYGGRLHTAGLTVSYTGTVSEAKSSFSDWSLGQMDLPKLDNGQIHWPSSRVGSAYKPPDPMVWHGAQGFSHTLWREGMQRVDWEVMARNSGVWAEGRCLGMGYVERLSMNVWPWQLGIRRLLWGRACASGISLVWIKWEGLHPLSLVWLNGELQANPCIDVHDVQTPGLRLNLAQRRALVRETLVEGSFARLPKQLASLCPQFLLAKQMKWAGSNEMWLGSGGTVACECIWEEVTWP